MPPAPQFRPPDEGQDRVVSGTASKARLRVRVGHSYNARFNSHHGQRNAELVARSLTPLARYVERLDSIALLEPGYDLIHTFNAVPVLTSCPFVVTFEDYLPRMPEDRPVPWLEAYLFRRLLRPQCIAVLGMSEYAVRQMKHQHRRRSELAQLLAKCEVLHPGIRPVRTAPKAAGKELTLLFVGSDFFRKGGPAVVRAHKALRAAGVPVRTTIVSSLRWSPDDYIGPPDPSGVAAAEAELAGDGITLHRSLPNAEVRRLMEQADFLILPTFHDTFGYVSLEAMATGTPVIATATCAQREVVEPGRSGYLLDFDNDDDVGKWRWIYGQKRPGYIEAYWSSIERLTSALVAQLQQCWEARSDYEVLSAGALARIETTFHADRARDRLEQIYERARRR
jgi:glycosyltransferase involved in cell wall biosynthesis